MFHLYLSSSRSEKISFLLKKTVDKHFMIWYNAIVVIVSSFKTKRRVIMRLFEFRGGVIHPYWLRNGRVIGVTLPVPVSQHFTRYGVRRVGRGYLFRAENRIVLFPECDPDSRALVMTGALERFNGGFIRLAEAPHFVVELLPGGSITVSGRRYIWDGRNLRRI
jgi:hypothetical protein